MIHREVARMRTWSSLKLYVGEKTSGCCVLIEILVCICRFSINNVESLCLDQRVSSPDPQKLSFYVF